jgi:DNA repair protein RecN (Recombination protein N)
MVGASPTRRRPMLRSLDIRDVLIIDRLSLELWPGLNVLTGETGAGKSILLDALGFVLGWRGRAELVRAGRRAGRGDGGLRPAPGHAARAVLDEAGSPPEDELILRRVNAADGRKTAFVNDRRVSGEVLRDLSDHLVELHGQHDDRGLLNPRGHRALLDAFAGLDLAPLRAAWARSARRGRRWPRPRGAGRAAAEEEFLRHAVAELDKLNPLPGEDAALDARRRLMQGAGRIREDVAKALMACRTRAPRAGCATRCAGWTGRRTRPRAARRPDGGAEPGADRTGRGAGRGGAGAGGAGLRSGRAGAGRGAAVRDPGAGAQAWRAGGRSGRLRRGAAARLAAIDGGAAGLPGWARRWPRPRRPMRAEAAR